MRHFKPSDITEFTAYTEFALADGDPRTLLLSFPEWLNAGRPGVPGRLRTVKVDKVSVAN